MSHDRPTWRNDIKKREDDKLYVNNSLYQLSYMLCCYSNESVLATEVVQIFCLVPTFIDTLIHQSHPGIVLFISSSRHFVVPCSL